MDIKKFLNIEIEPAPLEMKLDVELRCRDIMASDNVMDIRNFSIQLDKKHSKRLC